MYLLCFFFSSRRRHTRFDCDWSSDVCSSDLEIILFQQARKETLREVLGIFAGVTVPPDVGVKWIPIGAAQFLQGLRGLRCAPLSRRDHDGPVRRGEIVAGRAHRCSKSRFSGASGTCLALLGAVVAISLTTSIFRSSIQASPLPVSRRPQAICSACAGTSSTISWRVQSVVALIGRCCMLSKASASPRGPSTR